MSILDKREPIRLWVEGLRSDEYKQGRGQLFAYQENYPAELCCLGVACELTPNLRKKDLAGSRVYGQYSDKNYVPVEARDWLGILNKDPEVRLTENQLANSGDPNKVVWVALSKLNDIYHKSFHDIADYIENQDPDWTGVPK